MVMMQQADGQRHSHAGGCHHPPGADCLRFRWHIWILEIVMRGTLCFSSLAIIGGFLAAGCAGSQLPPAPAVAATVTPSGVRTVHLNEVLLARMRTQDPQRYEQVQAILIKAAEPCAPEPAHVQEAGTDSPTRCGMSLLETSNPPKRPIRFVVDDTTYTADVLITQDPPRVMPARQ
jgi:hypothetical protein